MTPLRNFRVMSFLNNSILVKSEKADNMNVEYDLQTLNLQTLSYK